MRGYRRLRMGLPRAWSRQGGWGRGWLRWAILGLATLYLLLRLLDLMLLRPVRTVAEVEARRIGSVAVNRVVTEQVSRSLGEGRLVEYEKDEAGRIAAYRINTTLVNQVSSEAAAAVHEELKRLSEQQIKLPIGAITGSTLLSNLGPRLAIRLVPIGNVQIEIRQEFMGEGINQTRHRIWIEATATMKIFLPLTTQEMVVSQELPLSDTVIVGPVPGSFYGGNLGGVTLPAR